MNCKVFIFVGLIALAGCGGSAPNSGTTTSNPVTPPPPTANTVISVSSPTAGAVVSSPFELKATATVCSSEAVTAVAYSVDRGTKTQVNGTAVDQQVTAAAGQHSVEVIATSASGGSCESELSITVTGATTGAPQTGPTVPANAIAVSDIQKQPNWKADHDAGSGGGTSTGAMTLVISPSRSGAALKFDTSFTSAGGERYHATLGSDAAAKHFLYDAWVYVVSPSNAIANVELDMNQVLANGQTVIYGFQCDGYSGTWDFTENAGTPEVPIDHWIHTIAACNPSKWSTDTWHHVQVTYSRDDAGNVTYESVWFDDARQDVNQTVPSAFALGWGNVLLTNFQVDGLGVSGSNTVYLDNLTITRW